MSLVFGRSGAGHRYDAALRDLYASGLEASALAANLRYDHRVTAAREAAFDKFVPTAPTSRCLQQSIVDYFENRVRTLPTPDFVRFAENGANIVTRVDSSPPKIHHDVELVRVLDLTGLHPVFRWAKQQRMGMFWDFPDDDRERQSWLDRVLLGKRSSDQEPFMRAVLDAMAARRRAAPFQPTWATMWDEFREYVDSEPARWLELVGMNRAVRGRWITLLRYRVREVGTLARPTQLDAGDYVYHFPSPPGVYCGHPMNLAVDETGITILPEFVHQQIDHPIEHWLAAFGIVKTTRATRSDLVNQRSAHHRGLLRKHGDPILQWMPVAL